MSWQPGLFMSALTSGLGFDNTNKLIVDPVKIPHPLLSYDSVLSTSPFHHPHLLLFIPWFFIFLNLRNHKTICTIESSQYLIQLFCLRNIFLSTLHGRMNDSIFCTLLSIDLHLFDRSCILCLFVDMYCCFLEVGKRWFNIKKYEHRKNVFIILQVHHTKAKVIILMCCFI